MHPVHADTLKKLKDRLLHVRSGIHHQAIFYQTRRMHRAHFIPDNFCILRAVARKIVPVCLAYRARLLQHALQFLISCSLHNYFDSITKLKPLFYYMYITPRIAIAYHTSWSFLLPYEPDIFLFFSSFCAAACTMSMPMSWLNIRTQLNTSASSSPISSACVFT